MSRWPIAAGTLPLLFLFFTLPACGGAPDPREVDGAIRYLADAIERDAPERLFRVIDARSRHAMCSIIKDRQAAVRAITEHYPEARRAEALARLGDLGGAADADALFAMRCDARCRQEFATKLAAAETVQGDDLDVQVHTVRGTTLHLHRLAAGDWWGLVWQTDELDAERSRAAEERRTIEANAAIFDRGRRLQQPEAQPSAAPTREPAQ